MGFTRDEIVGRDQVRVSTRADVLVASRNARRARDDAYPGQVTPTNEWPLASDRTGAFTFLSSRPWASKKASEVEPATSTSEKTTPKPFVRAGVVLPATWKFTRMIGLPTAMKILVGLNALNSFPYAGFRSARLLSLTRKPTPSVVNT